MPQPITVSNPFLLMLDPEQVLQAIERSQPLTALRRRTCRPLDKGLPGPDGEALVSSIEPPARLAGAEGLVSRYGGL